MRRKQQPKRVILGALDAMIAHLSNLRNDCAVRLKCEEDLAANIALARLELCPLTASTPEADDLWDEIIYRQRKTMDLILAHPPVGKPYPPFETHITLQEAKILGVSLDEPLTLRGHPLVIDYEPK